MIAKAATRVMRRTRRSVFVACKVEGSGGRGCSVSQHAECWTHRAQPRYRPVPVVGDQARCSWAGSSHGWHFLLLSPPGPSKMFHAALGGSVYAPRSEETIAGSGKRRAEAPKGPTLSCGPIGDSSCTWSYPVAPQAAQKRRCLRGGEPRTLGAALCPLQVDPGASC